ncbi:FkbM family methyltransferase [Bradyrhizobium sp. dw_78]|uniref:FkbM family methyltransferase n=1 Tax=Bradyrhizobium sp. dw_78 TaxID=2719793 RepID=UPI001BD3704E|nr:FkbM family methyltransferase [Bradyrhizobium sp. dw_78]
MFSRDAIKTTLQQAGLFPVARSIYRKFNPNIKKLRQRELLFYGDMISQKALCFDIGANLGQRSQVFLELGSRVVLVEPNESCLDTLRYEFSGNGKIEIVAKAVGSEEGEINFYAHGTDSTGSVNPDWDKKVFGSDRQQTARTVPVTTINSLIGSYGRPYFIKIDVEGFELEVLRGMSQAVPLLSFEYHYDDISNVARCLSYLESLSPISIRASNMDCEWLTSKTADLDSCLAQIETANAKGDLFVWSENC